MPSDAVSIRPVRPDEAAALGELCARSFFDDGGALFTEPDPARRIAANAPVFTAIVAELARAGDAFTTTDLDGVAAWERPADGAASSADAASVEFAIAMGLDAAATERLARMVAHFEHVRSLANGRDNAWHLALLGVRTDRQGAGIGSALVRAGLERVDAAGGRCYLETFPDRNVAFYRRFGFEVRADEPIPGTDILVRGMVREAQPQPGG